MWGIHRSPVNSQHKGQWRGALMFSLICASINDWVNNREAGDLGRHHAHYDVIVIYWLSYKSNYKYFRIFSVIVQCSSFEILSLLRPMMRDHSKRPLNLRTKSQKRLKSRQRLCVLECYFVHFGGKLGPLKYSVLLFSIGIAFVLKSKLIG